MNVPVAIIGTILLVSLCVIGYLVNILVKSQQATVSQISKSVESVIHKSEERLENLLQKHIEEREKLMIAHGVERDKLIDLALIERREREALLKAAEERHAAKTELMKESAKNQMKGRAPDPEEQYTIPIGRYQIREMKRQAMASQDAMIDGPITEDDSGVGGLMGDV